MRNSQSFFFKLCEYFENQSHFWSFLIKFSYCSIALLVKMESCNISLSQRVEGGFQWIWTWTCVYAFCFWQPFYHVLSFRVQVWHTRSILLCIVIENHIHAQRTHTRSVWKRKCAKVASIVRNGSQDIANAFVYKCTLYTVGGCGFLYLFEHKCQILLL